MKQETLFKAAVDNESDGSQVIDGHNYVDLGLPSGLKWATCNVGASSPTELGDLFSWGETRPKERYLWYTYIHSHEEEDEQWDEDDEEGVHNEMDKYSYDDEINVLEPEDDAASANWGGSWRMPTIQEFEELRDNCEVTWCKSNGVSGCRIKGPNGNCIFMPAAGWHNCDGRKAVGKAVAFWTSSLGDGNEINGYQDNYYAWGCGFDKAGELGSCSNDSRYIGESVRPVHE